MAKRIRKLGVMLLACALFVPASLAFAKTSADFSDLKDLDAATKAKFDAMINAGIFDGVSDSSFGLKEEMNRAQFAKVAALIMGLQVEADLKTSSFKDVKADDAANGWALPYIEAIKKAGITDGVGNGQFDPAGTVTKEQLATFLVRTLGKEADVKNTTGVNDGTVSDWAKGYVALALELKLLSNGEDGKFGGNTEASRDLLVASSFEMAREVEQPLKVDAAKLDGNKELTIDFTTAIDPKSIKLSNIKINGIALSDSLDSFELSADGKTLIVKLRPGFNPGSLANPVIDVAGVTTKFSNAITPPENPLVLEVTNAPPPVVTYNSPSSSGSLTVTSVTYSVYEPAIPTIDITVHYSGSGPATVYYVAAGALVDTSSYAPQDIKAMWQGSYTGDWISMQFCGDGALDGSSSGSTFIPDHPIMMPTYIYLVVEKDGQFSSIYELFVDPQL